MKVLQLCPKPLFPPMDGGKIAMLNTANGLREAGIEVHQLIISSPSHPFPASIPPEYPFPVQQVTIDTRVTVWGALKNLLSRRSYNLSRFDRPAFHAAVENQLDSHAYDIIQAESIYTLAALPLIRRYSAAPVVLRAHNVEHRIWERLARGCPSPLRKQYLRLLAKRLKKEELALCRRVDGLVVMSETDRDTFRELGVGVPVEVVGIGTGLTAPPEMPDQLEKLQLFHIGAMSWQPNVEGIDWFIREVWPGVREKLPAMRLVLAGHEMPERLRRMENLGIFVKEAPDARDFMLNEGLMIVPLLSGSGIRVKIIEGMALGKVIITTEAGVEGIPATADKELLIAPNARRFCDLIVNCFADPAWVSRISENARTFASLNFSTAVLTQRLLRFYNQLLKH